MGKDVQNLKIFCKNESHPCDNCRHGAAKICPYLSIYLYLSLYIYGFHHCGILRSSYRKLAWVGFEPTTTELRINALTNIAIRSWVQLAPSANFVQLPQFHLLVQCSRFIWVFAFVSHQICFKRSLAQVIALVAEFIYICKLYKRYTYDCI